jgi:hypothetical protein
VLTRLTQINRRVVELRHPGRGPTETAMTINQFYFVLFVLASFTGFGLFMAVSYVRYRRWLAKHPTRPL